MQSVNFGQVPTYTVTGPSSTASGQKSPKFGMVDGGVCSVPCCATTCALPLLLIAIPLLLLKFGGKSFKSLFKLKNLGQNPQQGFNPPTIKPPAPRIY